MSTTLTIRVEDELAEQLTRIAAATKRSKSFLAAEAVRVYVREEAVFLEHVEAGRRDVAAGRVVPHEEVVKWIDSLGTDKELPVPRSKKRAS